MPLARVAQRDDDAPAHEAEIAGVDRYRNVRQAPNRAVKDARRDDLERALARAPAARRVHDVVALTEFGEELSDQLGRILKVAVHQHDRVAAGGIEPGRRRDLMAEVARQRDHAQPRVVGGGSQQLGQRVVAAAVVDADELPRRRRLREAAHDAANATQQLLDARALVVEWDDHAECRVGTAADRHVRRGR